MLQIRYIHLWEFSIWILTIHAKKEYNSNITFNHNQSIYNMIKAFGIHHSVKDWVVHYSKDRNEEHFWSRLHLAIMNEQQNIGYVGKGKLHQQKSNSRIGVQSKATLNLCSLKKFNLLKDYIYENFMSSSESMNHVKIKNTQSSNVWLVKIPKNFSSNEIKMELKNSSLMYDMLSFVFQEREDNTIEIFDAYKIAKDTDVILKPFGTWDINRGLNIDDADIWSRRRSLEGYHLKATAAYSPPAITFIEDQCSSRKCFQGLFADAWHALQKRMNFTYTIKRAYEWGNLVNVSDWSGMVGMVKKREADIAIGDLTITHERSTAVHFLNSLMEVGEELFIKNPEDALSLESYTKPLTFISWIGIFCTILAVSPILAIISSYSEGTNAYRLDQCYNFVAQTLILRTANSLPKKDAARIVIGTLMFAGLVVYQYWEASLESMLAIRKPDIPFKSLEGLFQNSKYHLITAKGTVYIDQFKYSKDPFHIKVWNEKMKPYEDEFPFYENLAETTYKNQYSVAYGDLLLKEHELYKTCKIISLGLVIRTSRLAWAIGKDSHFKAVFHHNLNKLKEIGAIQKYSLSHGNTKQHCKDHGGDPISIKQCVSAFFLLIGGIVGGLFWFIIELCIPNSWFKKMICLGNRNFGQDVKCKRKKKCKKSKAPSNFLSYRELMYRNIKYQRRRHRMLSSKVVFERKGKTSLT